MYPVELHELSLHDVHNLQPEFPHKIWVQPSQITAVRAYLTHFTDFVDGKWILTSIAHGSIDIDGEEILVRETLPQICLAMLTAARKEKVQNTSDRVLELETVVLEMDLYYSEFYKQLRQSKQQSDQNNNRKDDETSVPPSDH
jgi:hypothetical protein